MNARPSLKLGIIGCGRAARRLHLPALQRVDRIDVVALADVDSAALHTTADAFGVVARYADYRALLDDASVEAVAVCVPAEFHERIGIDALEAGKHVLIEKPLALDLEACDRLIEAAAAAQTRAVIGFNLRHHRLVHEAAERVAAGEAGTIEAVRSTWTTDIRRQQTLSPWRDRRISGGGALFEIAVHHIDLWRFLLGTEVEKVYAAGRSILTEDETVALTATLSNGAVVSAVFSEQSTVESSVVIYGRNARISVCPFRFDGLSIQDAVSASDGMRGRLTRLMAFTRALPAGFASARIGGEYRRSYDREWAHFHDVVYNGTSPIATLMDGRRAVEVVLAAVESLETGQAVRVSEAPKRIRSGDEI